MKEITCTCGGTLSTPQLLIFGSPGRRIKNYAADRICRKCRKRYIYQISQWEVKNDTNFRTKNSSPMPKLP